MGEEERESGEREREERLGRGREEEREGGEREKTEFIASGYKTP